jgi:hypothetical protein
MKILYIYYLLKPNDLVPFRITQKQEKRHPYHPQASLLRDVAFYAYNNVYSINFGRRFTLNGIEVGLPFEDENGVRADRRGNFVIISTKFGVRVEFDGSYTHFIYVCDTYTGFVCGLCGNADGNRNNDFVDRDGRPVSTSGNYFTRFYRWGSSWRTGVDNTIDTDGKS